MKGVDGASSAKATRVLRQFYYLEKEQVLLVYDEINKTASARDTGARLYFSEKPIIASLKERVVKGSEFNGIIEYKDSNLIESRVNSEHNMLIYSPQPIITRLIGGHDYRTYVELDSDYTEYDGQFFDDGYEDERWFDKVAWRLETSPKSIKNVKLLTAIQMNEGNLLNINIKKPEQVVIVVDQQQVASVKFSSISNKNTGISRNDE